LPGGAGNWKIRAEVPILKGDDMQLRIYRTNNTPAVLAYGTELFSFASDTQAYLTTIDAFITVAVGDLIQLEAFSTGTAAYIGRHGYSGMVYYPSIGTTNFWTSRIEFSR
jgi:glucosamine 6-phosphate synthetase-like amidotransferase/phosphosugar isomerase protein